MARVLGSSRPLGHTEQVACPLCFRDRARTAQRGPRMVRRSVHSSRLYGHSRWRVMARLRTLREASHKRHAGQRASTRPCDPLLLRSPRDKPTWASMGEQTVVFAFVRRSACVVCRSPAGLHPVGFEHKSRQAIGQNVVTQDVATQVTGNAGLGERSGSLIQRLDHTTLWGSCARVCSPRSSLSTLAAPGSLLSSVPGSLSTSGAGLALEVGLHHAREPAA